MTKDDIIKEIEHIIQHTDDEQVLQDMLNLIKGVYKHYTAGNWER